MATKRIDFEQLQFAMENHGLTTSKLTLEKMCDDYNHFCSACSNTNQHNPQKFDCGCNAPKIIPDRRKN